jgi:hypothetical protein
MLVASIGSSAALDMGLARGLAADAVAPARLNFGELEPLVALLQETPPEKLLPLAVERLKAGTELKTLTCAAALANARAFGGQDYTGYHTFMALVPALCMSREMPAGREALPVLKVLYRNSARIEEQHAGDHDTLDAVEAHAGLGHSGEALQAAERAVDWKAAESQFAAAVAESPSDAFNELQYIVQDEANVHRVVLAWRAWAMFDLAGAPYAHALLRQSVRHCLAEEQNMRDRNSARSPIREVLPRLLDQYRLLGRAPGAKPAEDGQIEELARTIFAGTHEAAAEAAAAALAEGMLPEHVGEAISMAANLLVLHDPGRRPENSTPLKPPGCVHGDSTGVHASDAANAWRNIARVSNERNQMASLIVGAFHTAGQLPYVASDPFPYAILLSDVKGTTDSDLLGAAEEAIRGNDQARACAVVQRYGQLGLAERPLFDLLLKYAVSEDGALHAEKYYRTVCEESASIRPAYRWRQLVALARVTASEHGFPAAGMEEARWLLGLS